MCVTHRSLDQDWVRIWEDVGVPLYYTSCVTNVGEYDTIFLCNVTEQTSLDFINTDDRYMNLQPLCNTEKKTDRWEHPCENCHPSAIKEGDVPSSFLIHPKSRNVIL